MHAGIISKSESSPPDMTYMFFWCAKTDKEREGRAKNEANRIKQNNNNKIKKGNRLTSHLLVPGMTAL